MGINGDTSGKVMQKREKLTVLKIPLQMESLLPELALMVGKFLTPRDLAACCAVSVHWRELFGSDQVWKQLCDQEIEEHLRTTPCIVQPAFSVPHDEDSSLVPLGRWRLAFLREQHLWSNWRKGNVKTVGNIKTDEHKLKNMYQFLKWRFITNDFIVSFQLQSIELWDVRPVPPMRVASLDFDHQVECDSLVFEKGLIVLQSSHFIKILKVDVIEGTISPIYQVLYNRITRTPELICGNTPVCNETHSMFMSKFEVVIIKGKFCIGYFWFEAFNTFHIWDLESGMKLKQESLSNNLVEGRLGVVGSKTRDDVLVLVPHSADSDPLDQPNVKSVKFQCRVYDVRKLCFFSFSQTCSVFPDTLQVPAGLWECAITNNFVVLTDYAYYSLKSIRIFNYQTDQQIYKFKRIAHVDILADACFTFTYEKFFGTEEEERLCSVFCSSGVVVKDVTGCNVDDFEVSGNGLVAVFSPTGDSQVWGINRFSSFKTGVNWEVQSVNRACTRAITEKSPAGFFGSNWIQISHFW